MNSKQLAIQDAGGRAKTFFSDKTNSNAVKDKPDIQKELKDLDEGITNIATYAKEQEKDTTDTLSKKETALANVGKLFSKTGKRLAVGATQAGLTDLASQLKKPVTFFTSKKGGENAIINRASAYIELINTNKGEIPNISTTDIADLTAVLNTYLKTKDEPTIAKKNKKTKGTDHLKIACEKQETTLNNISDLMNSYFDNTDIANNFNSQVAIEVLGKRYTNIYITAKDSETKEIIVKPTVVFDDEPTVTYKASKKDKIVRVLKSKVGTRSGVVKAEGYKDTPFTVDAEKGKTKKLVVEMEAI